LAVRQTPVIEHLQQHVEDVGMRLLDLVQQEHGIRPTANGFGEITAFLVADVARRRADQTSHGVLLHELRHVDADHRLFGIEQELGERFAQLGLADTGRTQEQEGTVRPVRIRKPSARATDCIRHSLDRLGLADDALAERLFHAKQFLLLALEHFEIGMPVHLETTSATSSSVTLLRKSFVSCFSAAVA